MCVSWNRSNDYNNMHGATIKIIIIIINQYIYLVLRKLRFFGIIVQIYRVSIKSFPDYKHLLQENRMEYKHIFFFTIT
jgi:hypothetical protein